MPAIKKKWIKASQDGADVTEENDAEPVGDEDKDAIGTSETVPPHVKKSQKRSAHSPQHILRGLDGEVLLEKRKRFVPPAELKLSEWLDDNLEQRTEETLHLPNLYKYYTELCQAENSDVLDLQQFSRTVKDKFGKSFGIKVNSVYKALIKEKKLNKEKKKTGIKMKEIVHEAINHFGNPWGGVRFFALKTYIGTKYPAIQIDLRPKILKRALEMGVQYGQIELVKGIGMAGFYKLPGGEPPSPKKKENKEEESEEKEKEKDGESAEGVESVDEKDPEPKASDENGEKKEEGDEVKTKKHKLKKVEKVSYTSINHGDPQKIEDTFPLAITYQSAPKAVAATRIRKYIQEKYDEIVQDNRWRKAIESGIDKGYWEYASGSGISGKLHLLMDDFDPNSTSIEDRICAAIIACHEPKAASANQIKKYISQYHPDFKVDERPDLFKKALQRAVSKNIITQLSGLGASGTFQLSSHFVPSPLVLAGENDSDEDGGNDSGDDAVYIPKGTKSRGVPKVKTLAVVHSPPSKVRKNKPLKKTTKTKDKKTSLSDESDSDSQSQKPKGPKATTKGKKGKSNGKKPATHSASSDEGEEEDKDEPEYTPRKSQSRGGSSSAKATKNGKQKSKKNDSVLEDDDEDDDIEQEYTPRKSKSRGGAGKSSAKSDDDQQSQKKAKSKSAEKVVSEPKKNVRKAPSKPSEVHQSDEDEQQNKKKTPKSTPVAEASAAEDPKGKKNSRKRKAPETVVSDDEVAVEPKGKKNARKSKSKDENLSDDEEPEYTPRKSKSRESQIDQQPAPSDKKKRSRLY